VNIVGLSAYYHDSASCLLQDGQLVSAAQEERFSRVKHDARLPVAAFRYCLDEGGIDVLDVDAVAYYESPPKKLSRQLSAGAPGRSADLCSLDALRPEREIRERLGFEGRILTFDHHLSHAASSFFFSGFDEAAVLTVDGVGEWATTTYGAGRGARLELFEEVRFPHSLGLFYATVTSYLGFAVNSGEQKVMGLAPYGQPRYAGALRGVLRAGKDGQYALDMDYFDFVSGERMYSARLCELLGRAPREPESEITAFDEDVAASLQVVLEEVLLEKAAYLGGRVGSKNLCLAGGVALNCVANGRILREGPFERLFVQPAAGDAGGALGAAALAHVELTGERPSAERLSHVYLGPSYDDDAVAELLGAAGVEAAHFRGREAELLEAAAERLEAGKVLGWLQGRMEFGPRALGARSLLADPRDPGMRDRLNRLVKKREAFRPFAPSVLAEEASAHFELDHPSEFMLETCAVRSPLSLPAVTHVDGSARPQTVDARHAPRFAGLLRAFARRTGCPVLVNTSFNVRDEPIVCSPMDALNCMADSEIDSLVIGDFIVERAVLREELKTLLRQRARLGRRPVSRHRGSAVYTFV
jgi:carbamoyltransferase